MRVADRLEGSDRGKYVGRVEDYVDAETRLGCEARH